MCLSSITVRTKRIYLLEFKEKPIGGFNVFVRRPLDKNGQSEHKSMLIFLIWRGGERGGATFAEQFMD